MVVVETFAALGGKRSVRRAPTPRCWLKLVGAAKPQASDEDATRMNGIDGQLLSGACCVTKRICPSVVFSLFLEGPGDVPTLLLMLGT
jgi:hypothetical protein